MTHFGCNRQQEGADQPRDNDSPIAVAPLSPAAEQPTAVTNVDDPMAEPSASLPRAVFPGEPWVSAPRDLEHIQEPPKPDLAPPPFVSMATSSEKLLHDSTPWWVRFDSSGQQLLSATREGLYCWDAKSGALLKRIEWDGFAPVWSHMVSSDLRTYVAQNVDGLCVIDLPTGQLRYTLRGFPGNVQQLAISADGTRLGTTIAGTAFIWNLDDGKLLQTVRSNRQILRLYVGDDVRAITTVNWGRTNPWFERWSLETGEQLATLQIQRSLREPQFVGNGKDVADWIKPDPSIEILPAALQLIDFNTGATRPQIPAQPLPASRFETGADGSMTIFPADDLWLRMKRPRTLEIYRLTDGALVRQLKVAVSPQALSPDGKLLASIYGRQIHVWDFRTGELLTQPSLCTLMRPIIAKTDIADPFRVALHWEAPPVDGVAYMFPLPFSDAELDELATLNSLAVRIRTPSGRVHNLRPIFTDPLPAIVGEGGSHRGLISSAVLIERPTFFFTFDDLGVTTQGQRQFSGVWQGDDLPSFQEHGTYKVAISGRLVLQDKTEVPFVSADTEVHRSNVPRLATIRQHAVDKLREILPREDRPMIRDHDRFQRAFAPFNVFENSRGQRLLLFTVYREDWEADDFLVTVQPDGTVLQVDTWDRTTCIAEGTLIDTPEGARAIQDVAAGDEVWSYDTLSRVCVPTTVRQIVSAKVDETLLIASRLRVTASHPVFASGKWKPAGDLVVGDLLMDRFGQHVPAGMSRVEHGTVRVFDISVDEPHNFFAGGILVHNKTLMYPTGYFDPWNAFDFTPPDRSRRLVLP